METQVLKDQTGFITFKDLKHTQDRLKEELLENQKDVKNDLTKRLDSTDLRMEKVESKVEDLKDVVIPLTIAMNQVVDNTKEMNQSLKDLAKSQNETNAQINSQAISIVELRNITDGISDKKKYNAGITAGLITLAGIFIGGLFGLAPLFFN